MLNSVVPEIEQVKLVLVVAAEGSVQEGFVEALRAEGYGVITASDASVAANLFQSFSYSQGGVPFDLIIFTWMGSNVEELELCRLLRHQGNDVPIVILSIKGSEADRILALNAGADDCLSEPFNPQELIARCRTLLRRHHSSFSPEPKILQFEDLRINLQEHRVLVRGHEVSLSPMEFRLLELFVRHPRQIWSRQKLFAKLWGDSVTSKQETVQVHVRSLREKIEVRPGRPQYLITVPRLGYRLG